MTEENGETIAVSHTLKNLKIEEFVMSINKAILVGNLGKDPELRRTTQQMPVCSFSIATTERRKDPSGAWGEHTEWHNIVTFGTVAENCARYLKKGRQVFIEGRITTRKWQDKEGRDRYTTEIIASTVQFLGNRGGEAGESYTSSSGYEGGSGEQGGELSPSAYGLKSADAIGKSFANGGSGGFASGVGDEVSFDDDEIPF